MSAPAAPAVRARRARRARGAVAGPLRAPDHVTGMTRDRWIDVVVLTIATVLVLLVLLPVYGTAAALPAVLGGALLG
ncbi:MAG: hypothetical protein ACTMIR_12195, partial [Cellulomonadaceae bacterium]